MGVLVLEITPQKSHARGYRAFVVFVCSRAQLHPFNYILLRIKIADLNLAEACCAITAAPVLSPATASKEQQTVLHLKHLTRTNHSLSQSSRLL